MTIALAHRALKTRGSRGVAGVEAEDEAVEKRSALGAAARRLAVDRHSWREHTRKIVEALTKRMGQ